MNWWVLALLSGTALALRNVVFKVASHGIDGITGSMLLSLSMTVTLVGLYLYQRVTQGAPIVQIIDRNSFFYVVMAGFFLALANLLLIFSYQAGGNAGLVVVLQYALAVSLTVLLGILFLGESIKIFQTIGILTTAAGIYMITRG